MNRCSGSSSRGFTCDFYNHDEISATLIMRCNGGDLRLVWSVLFIDCCWRRFGWCLNFGGRLTLLVGRSISRSMDLDIVSQPSSFIRMSLVEGFESMDGGTGWSFGKRLISLWGWVRFMIFHLTVKRGWDLVDGPGLCWILHDVSDLKMGCVVAGRSLWFNV